MILRRTASFPSALREDHRSALSRVALDSRADPSRVRTARILLCLAVMPGRCTPHRLEMVTGASRKEVDAILEQPATAQQEVLGLGKFQPGASRSNTPYQLPRLDPEARSRIRSIMQVRRQPEYRRKRAKTLLLAERWKGQINVGKLARTAGVSRQAVHQSLRDLDAVKRLLRGLGRSRKTPIPPPVPSPANRAELEKSERDKPRLESDVELPPGQSKLKIPRIPKKIQRDLQQLSTDDLAGIQRRKRALLLLRTARLNAPLNLETLSRSSGVSRPVIYATLRNPRSAWTTLLKGSGRSRHIPKFRLTDTDRASLLLLTQDTWVSRRRAAWARALLLCGGRRFPAQLVDLASADGFPDRRSTRFSKTLREH